MSNELSAEQYQRLIAKGVVGSDDPAVVNEALGQAARPAPKPKAAPSVNQTPKVRTELDEFLEHGGYGRVEREALFHPRRKWRFDWYLPDQTMLFRGGVAIEYDGLMHHGANQGHASIGGILRDVEKLNAAAELGITVLRANAKNLGDGSFYALLDRVLFRIP